ncbi:MAG: hypothetical protein DWI21_13520 [Planctomycetota bacterium]|nr:MAG: hypothetical protein DWI21_13520 [Planctomycetota bacterium]
MSWRKRSCSKNALRAIGFHIAPWIQKGCPLECELRLVLKPAIVFVRCSFKARHSYALVSVGELASRVPRPGILNWI